MGAKFPRIRSRVASAEPVGTLGRGMGELDGMGNLLNLPYPPGGIGDPGSRLMISDQLLSEFVIAFLELVQFGLEALLEKYVDDTSNTGSIVCGNFR